VKTDGDCNVEVFGLFAFLLAAAALAKIRRLEKQLKEAGVLKDGTNEAQERGA
jgi:hypothetical protein